MLAKNYHSKRSLSNGFTLIELVVGIVLFSVAMVTVVSVMMPQGKRAIDPLWQVRGVFLAQSLLTEISSKAFDEASIVGSGQQACNNGTTSCTAASNLGPDSGESRGSFDDIDDYNNLDLTSGAQIVNAGGGSLSSDMIDLFLGFEAIVQVFYDDNTDGVNDDDVDNDGTSDSGGTLVGNQKLISVIVITPDGEQIPFAAYRKSV